MVTGLELADFESDSTSVLKYIKNEISIFRTFVANKVSDIQKISTVSQWGFDLQRVMGRHILEE